MVLCTVGSEYYKKYGVKYFDQVTSVPACGLHGRSSGCLFNIGGDLFLKRAQVVLLSEQVHIKTNEFNRQPIFGTFELHISFLLQLHSSNYFLSLWKTQIFG